MHLFNSIKRRWVRPALAGLFLVLVTIPGFATETNAPPRLWFLQIKWTGEQNFTLVKTIVASGSIKPTPEVADGLHFELQDANGKSLWQASTADPRKPAIEHADLADRGQLKALQLAVPTAEFMIRVPALTNATKVAFYQIANPSTNTAPARISIGEIPLPTK